MIEKSYSQLMREITNYLELVIDLREPAELYDVVRSFTALGKQFDEYIRLEHPAYAGETKIYVKEIRKGSIIAELIPVIQPLIQNMDSVLVVDGFITRYGGLLTSYLRGQKREDARKSDLEDIMGQVAAIAKDPNGSIAISSLEVDKTEKRTRVSMKFNTHESRKIEQEASNHKKEIEAKAYEVISNSLMVFWQSNVKDGGVGKRTGEKVMVEDVSSKPLAVVYDSDLAEDRIKHETKDGDRNLYKLGFYINGRVERLSGRPVAIRVSDVIDIIELPDED